MVKQYLYIEGEVQSISGDNRNTIIFINNEKYVLPIAYDYEVYVNDKIKIKCGKYSKYIIYVEYEE